MTTARRNLELEALDPDPSRTLAACRELGAEDQGVLRRRDTYFHAVLGRLELREAPPAVAELIAYRRADRADAVVSHHRIVPVTLEDDLLVARGHADLLVD